MENITTTNDHCSPLLTKTEDSRRDSAQETGAGKARERKRTSRLEAALPKGITLGKRKDGRTKPYFVRFGEDRRTESFETEAERNDRTDELLKAQEEEGSKVLNYDPKEWRAFQDWKAKQRKSPEVGAAVDDYLTLRLAEDIEEDSDTHLHLRKHLARFAAYFLGRQLDSITTDEVRTWLSGLKHPKTGKPMEKVTVKHHRHDLNTFLKRAVTEEWIEKNRCEAVAPPKVILAPKVPLKPEEAFRLLKVNRDNAVIGKMALELFGGLRSSSAGRSVKENIKFEDKGIYMRIHKSGSPKYRQGHHPVLWEWLTHVTEECWGISARNYDRYKTFAFVAAGWKRTPHNILRHSFASYRLAMLKNVQQVGYEMQHTNMATTIIYEGIADEKDAKLVFSMTPTAVLKTWEDFLSETQKPTP